uniref:Basonuclin zinc finger protein 1 n=1 Tax=Hippocampus comes TaxID=109280 RepID=A0A3Q2YJ09_HIPCM
MLVLGGDQKYVVEQAICCTLLNCTCDNFKPGKLKRRQCENCKHGWVAHALSKLKLHHMYQNGQVEIVHSNVVFDICSLMLYGTQAIPIRLKILLDRLLSVLKQEEVIKILNALDWTLQDYIRGYVLQDVAGKVLDCWAIMTFEEEIATLQQFRRFGETKSIVELMTREDKEGQAVLVPSTCTISDIHTFIERNTPCPPANLSTIKAEKLKDHNMHYFETFMKSMAFMLPFHLLNSMPAPFLGSPAGTCQQLHQHYQKTCQGSVEHQSQKQGDQEQDYPVTENPLHLPDSADTSHTASSSVAFTGVPDQPVECLSSTKVEVEDFSTGSGGGGSLKKGRVFCSACEKTFYDKGTLKIHYNAVHLKIKHKCTIEGCNMVFSSLRSRNRHSANPNPRLHMPMNRNNRDKDMRDNLPPEELDGGPKINIGSFPSRGQSGIFFPNGKTVQPVLPFFRSLVTPAELANTPETIPSLPPQSSSVSVKPTTVPNICNADPIPKKKPRKSSMPIKIEKEMLEQDEQIDQGSNFEQDHPLLNGDKELCGCHRAEGNIIYLGGGIEHEEKRVYFDEDQERKCSKCLLDQTTGMFKDEHKNENIQQGETATTMSSSSPLKNKLIKSLCDNQLASQEPGVNEEIDDKEWKNTLHEHNHVSKMKWCEHTLTNGNALQLSEHKKEPSESCVNCHDNSSLSDFDPSAFQFPHCEICGKTFKNHDGVKMHYQNVHLKELHICTVNGCSATFPSRRSRDRHSGNLNLHHKLMTKVHENKTKLIYTPSTHCQKSVIFRGHNHMGLVYAIRKNPLPLEHNKTSHKDGIPGLRGESGEDGIVLDLSTSSCATNHCTNSGRSCWDSDGVDHEEGDGAEEDVMALHMEDSGESCDVGIGRPQGGTLLHGGSEILIYGGEAQNGLQAGESESPITCHLCQKVYCNKGTFRAHYKTVHLKLLHKCKVPGCYMTFSSVRSRNRHSQNPNLHKNLVVTTGASLDQG